MTDVKIEYAQPMNEMKWFWCFEIFYLGQGRIVVCMQMQNHQKSRAKEACRRVERARNRIIFWSIASSLLGCIGYEKFDGLAVIPPRYD